MPPSRGIDPSALMGNVESDRLESESFTSETINRLFPSHVFTTTLLTRLFAKGVFSATSAVRSLFASGFVNTSLIEDGAVTGAKMVNPIKVALISGGSAGNHTVSGLSIRDELVFVFEQNGTSGILTDLTTEFDIKKADTIDNTGGTSTSSDKLLVMYISKS